MYVYYFHMYVYISVCSIIFHQAISWINVILRGFTLIYMQYRWNNLMFCSNRIHLTSCTLLNKDTVDKLPVRDTITELGNFVELLSLQEVSVIFYPHMHFHIQVWFTIPWDTESFAKKQWRRSANSWVPGRNSAQATRLESNQKSPNSCKFLGYFQIKI